MTEEYSGSYNIEIDADGDEVNIITPEGKSYTYTIQELEGKRIIDGLMHGGAKVTVYSQNQSYTIDEYEEKFGKPAM